MVLTSIMCNAIQKIPSFLWWKKFAKRFRALIFQTYPQFAKKVIDEMEGAKGTVKIINRDEEHKGIYIQVDDRPEKLIVPPGLPGPETPWSPEQVSAQHRYVEEFLTDMSNTLT